MKTTELGRKDRAKISALVLGELSPEESLDLLDKIEGDPEASQELEMEIDILNFMSEEGASLLVPQDKRVGILSELCASTSARWLWMPRKWRNALVVSTVLAVFLVAGWVAKTSLNGGAYNDLIAFSGPNLQVTLRGSPSLDIDLAARLYEEGEYDETAEVLERYVRVHPRDDGLDFVEYLLGTVYLQSAKGQRLLIFTRYDLQKVRQALEHLDAAIRLTSSERLIEECHWVRGMALLMIEERAGAILEFQAAADFGGPHKGEALSIIKRLQRG